MVKKTAIEVIRANRMKPISETLGQNYSNGFNRIPSPSGFDRLPEDNTQINLLPYFTEADSHQRHKSTARGKPTHFNFPELQYLNRDPKISIKSKVQ